jgi:solute carrier family 50 protein (sugar transporter)
MMDNKSFGVHLIGFLGNFVVFLLFASPLLTFSKVISTKDSSSINRPFAFCQVLNCATWCAYGLAISDVYIALPNFVGLLLGIAQVVLILMYRAAPPVEQLLAAAEEPGGLYAKFDRPSA